MGLQLLVWSERKERNRVSGCRLSDARVNGADVDPAIQVRPGHGGVRVALLALVLLAACTPSGPARPPTATEAEGFLAEVVRVARAGDFDALCDLGGGSCTDFLQESGGQNVPETAPTIVGGRVIEPTGVGAGRVGGYVLELCGTNAAGETYYSEMLVFFDFNGQLRGIEPEYWMGIRISETSEAGLHIDEEPPAVCEETS